MPSYLSCTPWLACRAITHGSLEALAYCHDRRVVHGALGSGSLMLSTFDDASWQRLAVKLDNFGFARIVRGGAGASPGGGGSGREGGGSSNTRGRGGGGAPPPTPARSPAPGPAAPDDTPLALGRRGDLRALAVVLLECLLSALAARGPSQASRREAGGQAGEHAKGKAVGGMACACWVGQLVSVASAMW